MRVYAGLIFFATIGDSEGKRIVVNTWSFVEANAAAWEIIRSGDYPVI